MADFKTGRIGFRSLKVENKTGRIQSCIQYSSVSQVGFIANAKFASRKN